MCLVCVSYTRAVRVRWLWLVFLLMIRRPPRSTLDRSSAASDVYKRQVNRRSGLIEAVGEPIPHEMDRKDAPSRQGCVSVFLSLIHISEPTRPY